ncbi:hypothetical protein RM555_00870 [Micromonospora sp. DSM 115977]|uniref:Uncharacterized protein n=1 Tax=Micromonospora reichwaldensis TaxID=3075516 RepID=A0ABU2WNQ0_9ACTN|nr:hypothetical protein [Micromonospora sp. DSM 115977]MDT0527538.1 hypothetical protein [Micromonospora sp. DSM 115977]
MSNRDWGRGEGGPREPVAPWDDPADPAPVDPYERAPARHRTPSRRRAVERGQREPVDSYLPRWALESGIRSVDGGGRHAAPDDEVGIEAEQPHSGAWRATETTSSWHRVSETSWRETPAIGAAPQSEHTGEWTLGAAPQSEHTGEWTFDRPQERGYSGRRRAEDDPVSGSAPPSRPRRLPSQRPQVVWSGLEEADVSGAVPDREAERPARRGRRTAEDRPAVDPWDRESHLAASESTPSLPAVDAWDASGVHAWRPAGEVDRWDHTDTGRWDRADDTGSWDRSDGTGRWDRADGTGEWRRSDDTGAWERCSDDGGWDRTAPGSGGGAVQEWPWPGRDDRSEGFWSGTRLAGDDPRWMDPPASAPRSPVVPYSAPRPRAAPRRRVAEPVGAATASAVRRRAGTAGAGAWGRRIEDDLLDPDPGGPWRSLLYTVACYLVPAVLIFVWLLTLDGQVPAGCVTDISGGGCDSPRARALGSLAAGLPRFGLALASSLVVALLLRRVGTTWRSASVALAAAVVGGGLSTVMISAVTGQPIG